MPLLAYHCHRLAQHLLPPVRIRREPPHLSCSTEMLLTGVLGSEVFSISLILAVTFILSATLRSWLQRFQHHKYPLLGAEHGNKGKREQEFLQNAGKLYENAYQSFKTLSQVSTPDGKAFHMSPFNQHLLTLASGEHLVIPNSYLDELKSKGDAEIDVTLAFEKVRLAENTSSIHSTSKRDRLTVI